MNKLEDWNFIRVAGQVADRSAFRYIDIRDGQVARNLITRKNRKIEKLEKHIPMPYDGPSEWIKPDVIPAYGDAPGSPQQVQKAPPKTTVKKWGPPTDKTKVYAKGITGTFRSRKRIRSPSPDVSNDEDYDELDDDHNVKASDF